jgi:hypothetical protein
VVRAVGMADTVFDRAVSRELPAVSSSASAAAGAKAPHGESEAGVSGGASGFDYFCIGVPGKEAIDNLASRLTAQGETHVGDPGRSARSLKGREPVASCVVLAAKPLWAIRCPHPVIASILQ